MLNDRRRVPREVRLEPAAYQDPASAASDRELGAAIAAAVLELPEPQRIAFVLREYHDLDYGEIAKVLDIDVGTVKSRLSRARTAVRDLLVQSHPDLLRGSR